MSPARRFGWMPLDAGLGVVVEADGRFRLHRAGPFDAPAACLDAIATPEATGALLGGALLAGLGRSTAPPPPASLPRLVYRLCGRYRTTHATPPALRRGAALFRAAGRNRLADFAERKADEETGHDRLVLLDLDALGLPAQKLLAALRPPGALALVAHLERLLAPPLPIGLFGYAYALERAALFVDQARIDAAQAVCPPGVDATRGMRVHSAVGADRDHVRALRDFIADLAPEERAEIARATYRTARIMASETPAMAPDDATIVNRLRRAGIAWPP